MATIILIRGGGDMASGVALRMFRAGFRVAVTELPQPLAIRRRVSFAEAIYNGECQVEEATGRVVKDPTDTLRIMQLFAKNLVPVLIDPQGEAIKALYPTVVVDARMLKEAVPLIPTRIKLIIGLGPGFTAGENCHAAIETQRGHRLGRVLWQGSPQLDSGIPDSVGSHQAERVLRAPASGVLETQVEIGDHVEAGQTVAVVGGENVLAPFAGVLRGILHPGVEVSQGLKIGDIDPRDDPSYCTLVSDKSLAVAGGVMEAILSRPELRPHLWK